MANTKKVTPRSLTRAYNEGEGDFSPDLVGLQFTNPNAFFTFGNFSVTTNLTPRFAKDFKVGGQWSDYYNLDNLQLTEDESSQIASPESKNEPASIRLNFNPYDISRYVYYGSFFELIKVTLQNIVQKWKGSLYVNPRIQGSYNLNTVLSYSYNSGDNTTTFLTPTAAIVNNYQLHIEKDVLFEVPSSELTNQDIDEEPENLIPIENGISNVLVNYTNYVVWDQRNNIKLDIIDLTGSTEDYPYLTIKTKGKAFPNISGKTFSQEYYHIMPNDKEIELFFENLTDFEKIILNRTSLPKYTASFTAPFESNGTISFIDKNFTWPVSDSYNLDINTDNYAEYVRSILALAQDFDNTKTDLISRRFISESIQEYDTDGGADEIYGRKVKKLLRIYGREFDEVKKYIDGISFANVVTYDKLDNTSDFIVKIIAKNLGLDVFLTTSSDQFNPLQDLIPTKSPFPGVTKGPSAKELEAELWRRLVLNAWWLFKSKGTRKVIEFFLKFFKVPECMVSLNEYVYLAKDKLDYNKVFKDIVKIYELNNIPLNLISMDSLPMDNNGFPKPKSNIVDNIMTLSYREDLASNYFQKGGFWYNGGSESTEGNNPHIGPYDFGKGYFSQFECFIDNFNTLLTGSSLVKVSENFFTDFNNGTFTFDQNGAPLPYYGVNYANLLNNSNLVKNVIVNSAGLTFIGGPNSAVYGVPNGDTFSLKISFTTGDGSSCNTGGRSFLDIVERPQFSNRLARPTCSGLVSYNNDGTVSQTDVNGNKTLIIDQNCCETYWLPMTNNTQKCVNPQNLIVTNDCVIKTKDLLTISKDCCNSQSLPGLSVYWDGQNCVNKDCAITKGLPITTQSSVNTITMTSFFQPTQQQSSNTFVCYWCPPKEFTKVFCNSGDYINELSSDEINKMATSLGWNSSITMSSRDFLIMTLSRNFQECILYDNNNNPIKNPQCCQLNGGQIITDDLGNTKCVIPSSLKCTEAFINDYHIYVDSNNNLVSQECCQNFGYTYTNGSIMVYNDGVYSKEQTDSVALNYVINLTNNTSKNYCTSCPTSINIQQSLITDLNGVNLTQKCCVDYGFNYDSVNGKCTKCPELINYISIGSNLPKVIVDLNRNNLTEYCCTQQDGIYKNVNNVNRCFVCAPNDDSSYTYGSQINFNNYIISELLYNNQSVKESCCTYMASSTNNPNIYWDSLQKKCFIKISNT